MGGLRPAGRRLAPRARRAVQSATRSAACRSGFGVASVGSRAQSRSRSAPRGREHPGRRRARSWRWASSRWVCAGRGVGPADRPARRFGVTRCRQQQRSSSAATTRAPSNVVSASTRPARASRRSSLRRRGARPRPRPACGSARHLHRRRGCGSVRCAARPPVDRSRGSRSFGRRPTCSGGACTTASRTNSPRDPRM